MLANKFVGSHRVDVILLSEKEPFYSLDPRINLRQFGTRGEGLARWVYYPRVARFLRSLVKTQKPDVVFSFGELISPFVKLSVAGLAQRVFVFNRGAPLRSLRGISGWLNPLVYPFTNGVVVQTDSALRMLNSRYRFSKFAVIPNPVELPANASDVLSRRKIIVNVGSIGRLKNQAGLLTAFSKIKNRGAWELHFVGDGPDRRRLETLSNQFGLVDRVKFLGERRDVPQILADSQVFAFTSLSEGFPNALAEGMAHGCACISFDCPAGPAELIEHDINGLLVPLGDERQYQLELSRLLSDEVLRDRLGKQARLDMREYSPEKVIDQFERLISASSN